MNAAASSRDADIDGKPVILVVEDEVLVRTATAEGLREAGLIVVEAANAAEAIAILAVRADVDVIFTDVNMPGEMNGLMLASWVAEHHPHIPVLITSGAGDVPMALRNGKVRRFIAKPYAPADIVARIQLFLED